MLSWIRKRVRQVQAVILGKFFSKHPVENIALRDAFRARLEIYDGAFCSVKLTYCAHLNQGSVEPTDWDRRYLAVGHSASGGRWEQPLLSMMRRSSWYYPVLIYHFGRMEGLVGLAAQGDREICLFV